METKEIEEKVYTALINNDRITGLLPQGSKSVFHNKALSVYPAYPVIVISVVSDVPVLHGDNSEKLHRVIMRVHIIIKELATSTEITAYTKLYTEIKEIMAGLGFTRYQSRPLITDGKRILVADFKIVIGG
ncbi:MAG: hypothetical protein IJT73_09825 [Selenomonadaceae bacterium]|nr:hypothetical protein [Selenomonadaceae bacterium]